MPSVFAGLRTVLPLGLLLLSGCLVSFSNTAGRDDSGVTDADLLDGSGADVSPEDAGQDDASQLCGNGEVDPGEECDDGINNSDTAPNACRNNCRAARCGDGARDSGEECDDGAANSDSTPNACRTSCLNPRCGDGIIDLGEQCDDGNTIDNDACVSSCLSASCGDGYIWSGVEACDDGGNVAGDGCSPGCMSENLPVLHWISSSSVGWSSWTMTYAGDPHAPTGPVTAAVYLEDVQARAMIFTSSSYHKLVVNTQQWSDHGDLTSIFSPIPATGLSAGVGNVTPGTTYLTLQVGTDAYSYEYNQFNGTILFTTSVYVPDIAAWSSPLAPDPTQLIAQWLDLGNAHQWTTATIQDACGPTSPPGIIGPHAVSIASTGQLHLLDAGYCFEFFDSMPVSSFPPFSEAGAPATAEIRGAFYSDSLDTLYVITQQ